jgi:DNA-binding PadR family transcriptional regulator
MQVGKAEIKDYITREVRHAVLKVILLKMIQNKKSYSYQLFKQIAKHHGFAKMDKKDIKNDVYNTISSLQNSGYITMSIEREKNRIKKYYKITKKGKDALSETQKIFKNAINEISRQLS